MIVIDEERIFDVISQKKPVTVALNAPDGMLPQVQETAVNITKKFDIPAFVLADTTSVSYTHLTLPTILLV